MTSGPSDNPHSSVSEHNLNDSASRKNTKNTEKTLAMAADTVLRAAADTADKIAATAEKTVKMTGKAIGVVPADEKKLRGDVLRLQVPKPSGGQHAITAGFSGGGVDSPGTGQADCPNERETSDASAAWADDKASKSTKGRSGKNDTGAGLAGKSSSLNTQSNEGTPSADKNASASIPVERTSSLLSRVSGDSIIIATILALITAATAFQYWHSIWHESRAPLRLVVLSFALGLTGGHIFWPAYDAKEADRVGDALLQKPTTEVALKENSAPADEVEITASRTSTSKKLDRQCRSEPTIATRAPQSRFLGAVRGLHSLDMFKSKVPSTQSLSKVPSMIALPSDIWTTLTEKAEHVKANWEMHVHDSPSSEMTGRLLKFEDFRTKKCVANSSRGSMRKPLHPVGKEQSEVTSVGDIIEDDMTRDGSIRLETIGRVDTGHTHASILQKDIEIDPLFRLRGMDVFKTDSPDERIWRQPILEESGLRDVPTFLINIMVPWCNLVLYFQMPDWVKCFKEIQEEETDSEDTKALKRFLAGDDAYRNPRWKILPCLVDGPMVIKMMSPEKKEITIHGNRLPLKWHQYDEHIDKKTRRKRAALLEVDCDLIADSAIRRICNLVRNHIKSVRIDCAMIVDKPYLAEAEEKSACLGLWRMDKIDMDSCAMMPEKSKEDLLREASTMLSRRDAALLKSLITETMVEETDESALQGG